MSKIIKLDKNLANQIAAGEVVERPISIVKELVENSIDAGATNIRIDIKNGGIDEIIITDNGEGILRGDLPLTIEKYTTSKIKNLDDLYNIMTFGFRGEALASISSVSNFEIISKTVEDNFGSSLKTNGGDNINLSDTASEQGTKIIIKDLFFNTPARLNYLKQARTEYTKILEFLNAIALSTPEVGIEFNSEGRNIFKYKQGENLNTRIYNIFGEEFSENIIDLHHEISGLSISGYISDPKVSFPNKNRQLIFINNRVVKSPLIFKAISNAYNRFIPHSNFPAYILHIDIDPTQIDVNVHPRKMEVRFANEASIFRGVFHSVEDKLTSVSLTTPSSSTSEVQGTPNFSGSSPTDTTPQYYTGSGTKFKSYSPYKDTTSNPNQGQITSALNFSRELLDANNLSSNNNSFEQSTDLHDTKLGKIIGQTFNSYIVVETNEGLKILDQHALAERVIYERLVNNSYSANTQGLLIGESITLTSNESDILKTSGEVFSDMGFDFEVMSNNIVIINGIPDFVVKEDIGKIFLGILDDIGEEEGIKSKTLDEIRNKIYAYASCRSAIKFGHKLNLFEMNKLLNDSVINYSATCPHGRPVVYEISLDEMKDKYER